MMICGNNPAEDRRQHRQHRCVKNTQDVKAMGKYRDGLSAKIYVEIEAWPRRQS
ncbi:MAG TPA: hypothetical protein VFD12_07240 [Oligella sp.]|nr:hypothetical protein [Oligella sp.]